MNGREPAHDTLARLDGGVQELLDDIVGMRRVQSINLLVTASVGAMITLAAACLAVVLLVGGGRAPEVTIEPLAAEIRALHSKLHALTQTQVAGTGIVTQGAATPDDGENVGASEAIVDAAPNENGSPGAAAATFSDTNPGVALEVSPPVPAKSLVRVTLVPAGSTPPQPFLVRAEEEVAALAVVDGLRPEDEVVAVETPAPELRASLQRRLGMRALLAHDRPAAKGVPTS